ncbi:MAG: DUF2059 domain-containing protein [Rhodanobacter sp.]
MEITHVHKMLDEQTARMESMMRRAQEQGLAGQPVDARRKKITDESTAKWSKLLHESLSWEKMEPMYMNLYRTTFSASEIGGMLTFYKSPSGQAVLAKMPTLMANLMQMVQDQMHDIVPQMKKIDESTRAQLHASESQNPDASQTQEPASTVHR